MSAKGFVTGSFAAEPVRLTRDGRLKLSPSFVEGGGAIVFSVHAEPNLVALVRVRGDDGSEERLHPVMAESQFDAAFSRDGRYHAYARSSTSPQLVLAIVDHQSNTEHLFNPGSDRMGVRSVKIAPDASRVCLSLSAPGGQQIATVDLDGNDLRPLTRSTGLNGWPDYSPDGRQIVFSSSRAGDFDIYLMDADGGNVRRIIESNGADIRPAFAPDGARIAFTSNRAGNYEVYVCDRAGRNLINLTDHPDRDDFPVWHPDNEHLLVVSHRAGQCDLYLHQVPPWTSDE